MEAPCRTTTTLSRSSPTLIARENGAANAGKASRKSSDGQVRGFACVTFAEWRSELHASVCIEKPQICDQVVFVVRGKRIGGRRYIGDHAITLCHIGLLR
jgi:hypothetical protein